MKIEELSVGDWVSIEINDENGHTYENDMVCGISYFPRKDEMGIVTKKYGEPDDLVTLYDVQPIILSKALLSSIFNENQDKEYCSYFNEQGLTLYVINCKFGLWNLIWDDNINTLTIEDDPVLQMKYVHQLQHFLRIIGSDIRINLESNGVQ